MLVKKIALPRSDFRTCFSASLTGILTFRRRITRRFDALCFAHYETRQYIYSMQTEQKERRRRLLYICAISMLLGGFAILVAKTLLLLVNLVTNVAYHHQFSFSATSPWTHSLGTWSILIPILGGIVVGIMARFGSSAIRGHGIPEAMEKILIDDSRIPSRMTWLKPLSSAIAIGTGGPFGAEGPIIATGGALGSWLGQIFPVTGTERKILLASGAAAGMTAIFSTPVSAVLLAVELLLFEFRAKSFIPVAMAAATAGTLRTLMMEPSPVFPMPSFGLLESKAFVAIIFLGLFMGLLSVVVTKSVYAIEDLFEKLPVHWMWWPALGGLAVGIVGVIEPRTLGVGYENITMALSGEFTISAAVTLCLWKFISWSISLGSGTSGGTLAPLLTLGGLLGLAAGHVLVYFFPNAGIDPHVIALAGMAALFSGCSRAILTSTVFVFEATLQPLSLIPLITACSFSYLVSSLLMENSIMTEKIVRRGIKVPHEYHPRP